MNILLLSNSAPNYRYFFNYLVKRLYQDGAKVFIAVDCSYSRDNNELDSLGFDVYEFALFFASHVTNYELLADYSEFNLNAALLSDYERSQVYGIGGIKDQYYYDRLKSALLTFYETIFNNNSIDAVLYENVSNTFSHFALFVAQRHNIKYIGIGGSRLPGRFSISSDPLQDDKPENYFKKISTGECVIPSEVIEWCNEYISGIDNIVPDYMKTNKLDDIQLISRYWKKERIKTVARLLSHFGDDSYHSFQMGNPLLTYLNLFARNLRRRLKVIKLRNYYDVPVEGESFLLYPMHFHPESSTSILAGTYLDEYEVIRNIAFNLPVGTILYVKDHVSAWGYPSLEFYNKLKYLPNVRVLSPNEPTKQLIKKSIAVITLTSTVGYEALLLGKKVFLFGDVFYEFHKNVVKITNPSNLFHILNENMGVTGEDNARYNLEFIAAYYLSTYKGSLNLMKKDSDAEKIVDELYPIIRSNIF